MSRAEFRRQNEKPISIQCNREVAFQQFASFLKDESCTRPAHITAEVNQLFHYDSRRRKKWIIISLKTLSEEEADIAVNDAFKWFICSSLTSNHHDNELIVTTSHRHRVLRPWSSAASTSWTSKFSSSGAELLASDFRRLACWRWIVLIRAMTNLDTSSQRALPSLLLLRFYELVSRSSETRPSVSVSVQDRGEWQTLS